MYELQPTTFTLLNIVIVNLQLNELNKAKMVLEALKFKDLGERQYLYFGSYADYYLKQGERDLAKSYFEKAIYKSSNSLEKEYLRKKVERLKC